jgi:hypothetical protein
MRQSVESYPADTASGTARKTTPRRMKPPRPSPRGRDGLRGYPPVARIPNCSSLIASSSSSTETAGATVCQGRPPAARTPCQTTRSPPPSGPAAKPERREGSRPPHPRSPAHRPSPHESAGRDHEVCHQGCPTGLDGTAGHGFEHRFRRCSEQGRHVVNVRPGSSFSWSPSRLGLPRRRPGPCWQRRVPRR